MSESATEGGQQNGTGTGEEHGGENGQRSFTQAELEEMVTRRLAQERKKYADYGDLKKKAAEFDQLTEQQKSEAEKAVEAARGEGRAEALKAANDRLLKAEIRAAAAGKLSDPADAIRLLDLASFKVGDDGEIDSGAIGAAIEELIKTKPYLAAKASGFQGTGDGGAAGREGRPSQLTAADLKTMSPAQIVKAREEGRLDRYMNSGG